MNPLKVFVKSFSFVLILAFSNVVLAMKHTPCSGADGEIHVNPDNSLGGFRAYTAEVGASVFMAEDTSVCDFSSVDEGVILMGRAQVSGRAILRGKIKIEGNSRIYGEAVLINRYGSRMQIMDDAKIYGSAYVNGSVIIGDSSEVFGFGKVLDFSTVLGDSRICGYSVVNGSEFLMDDQTKCLQR